MLAFATMGAFALTTLALGLLLAATPYLMRKSECFAVTVPPTAQTDPRIAALKKRYAVAMSVVTVVFTLVALGAGALIGFGADQQSARAVEAGTAAACASVAGPLIAAFVLMLRNRRVVMDIKRQEGWAASRRERVAVIGERDLPGAIPLAWNLLYVVVALVTLAIGLALYPSMPDRIPMHADLAGNVTGWAEKSPLSVFGFSLLIEALLGLVFFGSHAAMVYSKRPTDPGAPATSALAYGLFVRAESIFLVAMGVALSAFIGIGFMLSSAGVITLWQFGLAAIVVTIVILIGAVALSLVYGQNGSRLFRRMQADDLMPDDDDEHWKLGVFYFNRDDESVFLPERFGIGWTVNFARPAVWILIGCFVATDVTVILCIALLA